MLLLMGCTVLTAVCGLQDAAGSLADQLWMPWHLIVVVRLLLPGLMQCKQR